MTTPVLIVPGLNCDARAFAPHIPALWEFGPVTVATHTTGSTMAEIAAAILADAPPRFALLGFSMGGYLSFEVLRQARDRVKRLCLLDTSARPDNAEGTANRLAAIAKTEAGEFEVVIRAQFPKSVDAANLNNAAVRELHLAMARACGPELFVRHQQAIMARPDSRGELAAIDVPTTVIVGEGDQITPPEVAKEMADGISGAELEVIPNAGHLALAEQVELVRLAFARWMNG